MTSTTTPSTGELPAIIRALCPSGYADLADDLFAKLTHLEAQPAMRTKNMRQVKIVAAEAKDKALEDAIALVLKHKRKALMKLGWKDRTSFIKKQLELTPIAYGLPLDYADTARERDIRLIREVLHAWEKTNGCYRKSVPLV